MEKIFTLFAAVLFVVAANAQDSTVKAVDLGVSVQWGDRFIGSTDVNTVGGYYGFGETATKSDYSWANYAYKDSSFITVDKYFGSVYFTTATPNIKDVATETLGKGWRMPTLKEAEELAENCTFSKVKDPNEDSKTRGIIKISAAKGDNSITLCATGYYNGTDYAAISYPYGKVAFYVSTLDAAEYSNDKFEAVYSSIMCSARYADVKMQAENCNDTPYYGMCILPVYDNRESAIESITDDTKATTASRKYFQNGKLYIVKDGKLYNAAGAQVK